MDNGALPGEVTSGGVRQRKNAGLKRMQRTATCLLGAMIAVLLVSVVYQTRYPWLTWLRAFAEAGAVGAIADWYAVVALFRRPFGLPIPHTAIIPQNQQRIAESLGSFVRENFLTPDLLIGKLRGHNAAGWLAAWLAEPDTSKAIADAVANAIPGLLNGLDDAEVARFFERTAMLQLRTLDVSRIAGNILEVLTEEKRHQPLLDRALLALEQWLTANTGLIKAKFNAASKYTPAPLDAYIVNKFVEGIVALLHEVVANPDHELRLQFDLTVRDLIFSLQTSIDYRRIGKVWMRDCIRYLRSGDPCRALWETIRTRVKTDVVRENSLLRSVTASVLVSLGKGLRDEPAFQTKLNTWWLDLAHTIVRRYRHQISALITGVVKSWDPEDVSRKVEAEIGRDLQYIRINGTFVGGMVGVLLHAVMLLAVLH